MRDEVATFTQLETVEKVIKYAEGLKLMDDVKAAAYIECSSKNFTGLTEVFMTAARVTLNSSKSRECAQSKCILL